MSYSWKVGVMETVPNTTVGNAPETPADAVSRPTAIPQPKGGSALVAALARAQGAMSNVGFDRVNPHFRSKYASLAAVLDMIRKPLTENGLAITSVLRHGWLSEAGRGYSTLVTTLHHESGESLASEHPLPVDVKPQERGSALTYARRYSICALLNISADDDDDANAAQTATGNGNGKITDEQANQLLELIAETGSDEEKLCRFAGVTNVSQIKPTQFAELVAMLKAKQAKPQPQKKATKDEAR